MSDKPYENDQSSSPANAKKPYAAPELLKWGTLRDITKAVGGQGNQDNNKGPRNRTRA